MPLISGWVTIRVLVTNPRHIYIRSNQLYSLHGQIPTKITFGLMTIDVEASTQQKIIYIYMKDEVQL